MSMDLGVQGYTDIIPFRIRPLAWPTKGLLSNENTHERAHSAKKYIQEKVDNPGV